MIIKITETNFRKFIEEQVLKSLREGGDVAKDMILQGSRGLKKMSNDDLLKVAKDLAHELHYDSVEEFVQNEADYYAEEEDVIPVLSIVKSKKKKKA